MPNKENPYDDFVMHLARLVEDLLKDMPNEDTTRIIGCTIITGDPSGQPRVIRMGQQPEKEIAYELIESDDNLYITAGIPADIQSAAYANISPDVVYLVVNEQKTRVDLPCTVDIIHSHYQLRHGVLDVILKKKKNLQKEAL